MNMNTPKSSRSVVEQITNNTTGWIGHHPHENKAIGKGQTFIAATEADMESIAVYANIVSKPGTLMMTLHTYDPQQKSWGPALGSASVRLTKTDTEKWIAFNLPAVHLDQGKAYGFRLESDDSFIGVGEAALTKQPSVTGQEWQFINNDQKGKAFSYFSLAFKVGLRAA
jgi:hypothetical protein